jgi:propionate CoA-transferase
MKPVKISADEAVRCIPSNSTICIGGGGAGHAVPDALIKAIGDRYHKELNPKNLTIIHPCGIGDSDYRGLNYLAVKGLARRVIGGFYGNAPAMSELAMDNGFQAYNFPQGVLQHLLRSVASGKEGLLTKTGLHTFVDPRYEGGKVNQVISENLVELVQINGTEYLYYKTIPVDVSLIRGTWVDKNGNLCMDEEVAYFSMLSVAQAAKVNNGIVIAQVKRVEEDQCALPGHVKVPGVFIDYIVEVPDQPMTYLTSYDDSLITRDHPFNMDELSLNGIKKIVARRAIMEIPKGAFVNLGYGLADGIPVLAHQEGILDKVCFFIEQGPLGGIPTTGLNFGAMYNPDVILDDGYQFDFFHGGGLDIAFLGFAQVDEKGNVNSSRFSGRVTGCGGFIDISQHTQKVIFCGQFAGKSVLEIEDCAFRVKEKGKFKKFVKSVEQITFNGGYANQKGQSVFYLTERCMFQLGEEGLILIEIAPGIDLENDVLSMMDFTPQISPDLKIMPSYVFSGPLPWPV